MTLLLITIILAAGLIISIAFNYYQKNKINIAMQLLAMKNENIMLAIRAGNIAVWGFDVATGHLYNIEGEVFPEGGVTIEQAMSEVHPDDREQFGAIFQEVTRGVLPKETICIRFRNMYTGEWEYIEKEFAVILSRTGEVETIIGTHKDVTKRVREAERVDELLTKCRKLYNENQTILNSLPIGVSIYNKDGDLVYFNQSNAKMFQMRDQEMVYQAKFNLWKHPYMGSDLRGILDGEKETIFTYQVDCSRLPIEYCIPSDRFLNISCYSNVVKNEAGEVESYIFLHRDITLQEEQARKMKDMSETLMRVIDASGFSVWEFSIKERKFYSYRGNICVEDGTSYEDTIAAYTPESAQLCEKVFHNLINGVSEAEHAIFESFDKNGQGIKYFKCELVARKNADNVIDKIYGIEKEITDERNYQLELEESKLKTQLTIQASDMVQWEYDVEKRMFYILDENGQNNVMIDQDYYRISHPDDLLKVQKIIEQMDTQVDEVYELDVRFKSSVSDEWQYVRINGTPLKYDQKGKVIKYTGFQRNNTQWHNMTEKLKEINKMNKQILNNMRSGLVYLTPEYEVIWENTSDKFSLDFTDGHKLFEVGKRCHQTHLGRSKICDECVLEKVKAERHSFVAERTLDNGNVIEMIGNPIIDENNDFTGIILRLDNITERKRLYEELEKSRNEALSSNRLLREVLDRVPGALFIKDPYDDYRYVIVNKVFCDIIGKTESEIIGKTDFDIMPYEDAMRFKESDHEATVSMTTVVVEKETYSRNAYHCWKTIKAAFPYRNDNPLLITMSVDITEICQTNYELQKAKEKAEESDRLKSAFLANMSHEIRTPLNAIVGFSELLASCDSESEKQEYLRIISTNNDLLLRLINDVLDLSKLESGVIQLHDSKFDMVPYFNELAQSMQQRITNPAVEFIVVNPYKRCVINADKERMAQVLFNYLTNAVKYTPSGFIKMGYEVIDDGVCIYVEDSGIGVPDDKKCKLFHRFEKLDSFAQGTGLGLSICKAITELNGGKVGFESTEGQGSRFWSWKPVVVDVVYKADDV